MKPIVFKIAALMLIVSVIGLGCAKQQYRAHSKKYPHEVPQKQH